MAEYVDKNDVYRVARESFADSGMFGTLALSIFETAIKQLPAVDVEKAKHAKWKDYDDNGRFICTNCAFVVYQVYNYCPFCGASMEWWI